ncbi:MAG TPA: alanine--tRNA ligase [SAR86 cluster bacterium]|jgi:alanyl-tRNA synthetase|nr:alanine--tRNA ligase [SAR86 cluster bacterium]|tara:strand:+ start:407 stop:3208 length:2802 start_codon:yes stop_codon:yes gene_type:complete
MKRNLTTNEIRNIYLEYFQENGHELVESASLIPHNDPSLLFTNAGMVPFKDLLLGVEKRDYTRATSSQRCLRVGGKHNDLDNVGYTARHHTFFEMLGNFSFGDYFKEDAIAFAWELLTERYEIPPEKLWITVHKDDDESEQIWIEKIGVDPRRISRLDDDENFWTMGDTGPCGPCSEIYYDHGDHIEGEPPTMESDPGDRFIEIWNLVFTQFDRSKDGTLSPLPNPCVDTGMGLERMAAVLQEEHNNYNIDLFSKLVSKAGELTQVNDSENPSLRVIADHLRASSFLIADGIVPSNEGRGYVLRRIIRRALRHANKLGMKGTLLASMVPTLIEEMGDAHPLLKKESKIIEANLLKEEQQFSETLIQGMSLLKSEIEVLKGKVIPGETIFKLYDTFGFPADMTADFARENGLEVDLVEYEELMLQQKERARSSNSFSSVLPESLSIEGSTEFIGYEHKNANTKIVELISSTKETKSKTLVEDEEGVVILEETPFYAESGGQIGDRGTISGKGFVFDVLDTQKIGDHHGHFGVVREGNLKIDTKVKAHIDESFREKIVPNHSATHLLQAALKKILGDHIEQKGSLVGDNRLRFDFSHSEPVSAEQLLDIEDLVNLQIEKNSKSITEVMAIEEATKKGAIAFFGEKYGEEVRVLDLGEGFSVELCGGTHVKATGEIGLMKIISESGISAGVRRIEAVTGIGATLLLQELEQNITSICNELLVDLQPIDKDQNNLDLIRDLQSQLNLLAKELNTSQDQILKRILDMKVRITSLESTLGSKSEIKPSSSNLIDAVKGLKSLSKSLESESKEKEREEISTSIADLKEGSIDVAGYKLITKSFKNIDSNSLRELADQLRNNEPNTIATLISVSGDKIPLIVACSKEVEIDAREIMKHLVNQLGGSGGGRPDFAQGGADTSEDLEIALDSVADLVVSLTNQ